MSARPQFGFLEELERDIEIGAERGSEIGAEIAVERDIERLEGGGFGINRGGYESKLQYSFENDHKRENDFFPLQV